MADEVKSMEMLEAELKKQEGILSKGLEEHENKWTKSMKEAEAKILALETEKKAWLDRLSAMEVKAARPDFGQPSELARFATPGQRFILSAQYQTARELKRAIVEAFEVGSLFERKQIPGATRGDLPPDRAPVWADREPEIIFEPGQRAMTILNLLASSPPGSNSIEYFREVLDNTKPGPGSQKQETGGKNQMGMNFVKEMAVVETIAGWLPASRQVLEDAPQLQAYIDGRLTYFVQAEAERQILFGTGVGGQLLGLMNTPGIVSVPAPAGNVTNIDVIRMAIATVRMSDYQATGVVLNPADWAAIELLKDGTQRYLWVQVTVGGDMRLWRLPVIETTVMQPGQYLVGAFGLGAKVWDRQQATIRVSESHADFFIRNAVAILGEMRLALACYRPSAFAKGVFDSWKSS